MSLYKTKGIVLKSIKLGEADKIVSIFSRTRGKIRAVAKGLRKTKSKFGARLEPFSCVDLVLYEGRNLDLITQVELISSYKEIRNNYEKLTYGSAILNLVDKASLERQQENKLFILLLKVLEILSKKSLSWKEDNLLLLVIAFELKLMHILGFQPNFLFCNGCGQKNFSNSSKIVFSPSQGGIICEECFRDNFGGNKITLREVRILKELATVEIERVFSFKIFPEEQRRLANFSKEYVDYYMQARLKGREYLERKNCKF